MKYISLTAHRLYLLQLLLASSAIVLLLQIGMQMGDAEVRWQGAIYGPAPLPTIQKIETLKKSSSSSSATHKGPIRLRLPLKKATKPIGLTQRNR